MRSFLVILFLLSLCFHANAQIFFKGEYIGRSSYKDIDGNKTGGKGSAYVLSGGVQIPLSMKLNEKNRPTAWGITLGGSYTSLENKNIPCDLSPDEILNAQIALMHMRPISQNWSILASVGAGAYTAHTDLSKIGMRNILASGGVIFIWHLRDNLDIGFGPAVNTSFGYPMIFPAFYLNWTLSGLYEFKVYMLNAFEVSAGMNVHKNIKLSIIGEADGALALEKIDGKNMMFSHQYMITGFRSEFTFGKLSIPVTAGISAYRPAFYEERSLKAFFKAMDREHDPNFTIAPYVSVAMRYQF